MQSVDPKPPVFCSASQLLQEISEYNSLPSRFFPNFDYRRMLAEVSDCRVVKQNNRRQVYSLNTPGGGYYLKVSTLIRSKDRWRHLLFPTRRWAEWRNLHRLVSAGIPVARPVMKGWQDGPQQRLFFIITEKISGLTPKCDSAGPATKLGRFIARLHSRGVYHVDLHPNNIILRSDDELCLIDVQQVYVLPALPRRLRIHNLGKFFYHVDKTADAMKQCDAFLQGYNQDMKKPVSTAELLIAAARHENKRLRSRAKRCCKNSTDFEIVKNRDLKGFKRRDFPWSVAQLHHALQKAVAIKTGRVFRYQAACIKRHRRKIFHQDRCLTSWKMSHTLAVRGVSAPQALGYFKLAGHSLFVSEFLDDSMLLNDYLSALNDAGQKRSVLKKLAHWLNKIHSLNIWQRDFKSRNVLCRDDEFFLLDLEGVKIRRLSRNNRIVNLAQLNASVSQVVTLKDRLRFFHHYWTDEKLSRNQRRAIYAKIWGISKTKSTKHYNLDLDALLHR